MRIKPLALATACACAASLASTASEAALPQMETTLYGIVGIDAVNASNVYDAPSGKSFAKSYVDNSAQASSRLGFKGSHDINADLKVVFGIEAGLRADTGETTASRLFNRGTYLGLNGKFGSFSAGRQWNLNDDSVCNFIVCGGYAMFRFSEFGDTSNLYDNSLKYYTPKLAGFQMGLMFGAGEANTSTDGGNMAEAIATYSGPVNAMLSYHMSKDSAGNRTDRLVTAGINTTIGPVRPRLAYAVAHYPSIPSNASSYDIGLDFTVTKPFVLSLDYVSRDKKKSPDDTHYLRLRGVYALDSAFSVNANLIYLKNKGAGKQVFYGDGKAGQGQRVVGVGMVYQF